MNNLHAASSQWTSHAWDAPRITTAGYCHEKSDDSRWPGDTGKHGGTVRCASMPHFDALAAEAERVGWPVEYRRDVFVHDRNTLNRVPVECPLLWILRECGSHLYLSTLDAIDGTNAHAWDACRFVARAFGSERCRFYTWDGARLREHRTPETAAEACRQLAVRYASGPRACYASGRK